MLSAANSSVQSSSDNNGLLNNNTLDAFKSDQTIESSLPQTLRQQVTVYREIRPSRASPPNGGDMSSQSSQSSKNESTEKANLGKLVPDQSEDVTFDKAATGESSTKVAGTWCPPIQALSTQTASLFSDLNGKKVVKTSRDVKDNSPTSRSDSTTKIILERIVRAPCVKVEPQNSPTSLIYSQMHNTTLSNGVKAISIPPVKIEKQEPESMVITPSQMNTQLVDPTTSQEASNESIVTRLTGMVASANTSVNFPKTPDSTDQKTFLLAVTPAIKQSLSLKIDNSPPARDNSESEMITPASPVPVEANGPLKKPCNCTKSSCLKLYCECFAQGVTCSGCNCTNCMNNETYMEERNRAIKMILVRNPAAFQSKIEKTYGHVKGCNCKKSNCLKNYCECYEAKMACTSLCRCLRCQNTDHSQAMEMVRRSVYAKIMSKDVPGPSMYNSPSTSSSVHEGGANETNTIHADKKRSSNSTRLSLNTELSSMVPIQSEKSTVQVRKPSRSLDMAISVAKMPVSPLEQTDMVSQKRNDEPVSPRSKAQSLKRIRPSGNSHRRNVTPSALIAASSHSDNPAKPEVERTPKSTSKATEGMSNLAQTIDEVVASSVRPESRRQKTVPCSSLSLPIAKRARVSVGGESGTSAASSSNSSNHLTLPISDDVSSDTSGPREDEFTAEELATMKGIRERYATCPDISAAAMVIDGATSTATAPHINDESSMTMDQTQNDAAADLEDDCRAANGIDCADVASCSETAPSSQRFLPSAATTTAEEQQDDGSNRRSLVVLPDHETPNILSFLQTSQLQIDAALSGGGVVGAGGGPGAPLAISVANTSSGGGSKLLYSILNPSSSIGLVSLPGVHRQTTAFRPVTVAAAVANVNGNGGGGNTGGGGGGGNGGGGGVVHWRPQQHPTASPTLPTASQPPSQQQQQSSQPQQQQPQQPSPASPSVQSTGARSVTLSQLTDLVDGENGLRAQMMTLERQVSEMRRSQIHQTRMLTQIHRALMRRQPHQPIGSNRWNSASSTGASSTVQQHRRRRHWRKARDS